MNKPKTAADLTVGDQIPTRKPNPVGPVTVVGIEHDPGDVGWPACVYVDIECGPDADPSGFFIHDACGAQSSSYISGRALQPPHRYRLRYQPGDLIPQVGDEPTSTYSAKRRAREQEES